LQLGRVRRAVDGNDLTTVSRGDPHPLIADGQRRGRRIQLDRRGRLCWLRSAGLVVVPAGGENERKDDRCGYSEPSD
jgi:hypothetical protein